MATRNLCSLTLIKCFCYLLYTSGVSDENEILYFTGCECLVYSATYGKEYGTFSSPDYPRPYPPTINCLLYTFVANRDEIIEITFKDFDVHKSHLE